MLAQINDPGSDPDHPILLAALAVAVLILTIRLAWRHRHLLAELADGAFHDARQSRQDQGR